MNTHDNNQYNPRLQPNAKDLRYRLTKSEACLWKYVLKGRALKGYQFRRQRPIDQYIADFVCLPLKLIIEVDGITHTYGEVANSDKVRQAKLESLGFKVIRFEDDEVLTQINRVRESILVAIDEIEQNPPLQQL